MKRCYKCTESKPHSEFHKSANRSDGYNSRCKQCQTEYNKSRYHSDKNSFKIKRIQKRYGLSAKPYAEMLSSGCEVCGTMESLFIDHDHSCCNTENTCGKCVRGILCRACNTAEGMLKSNLENARKLVAYMEKFNDR